MRTSIRTTNTKLSVIIMTLLVCSLIVSFIIGENATAKTTYSSFDQDIKVDKADEEIEINAAGCTTDKQYRFTKNATNVTFTMRPTSSLVMDSSGKEHGPIKLEKGADVTIKMYGDITLKGGHDSGFGKNYGHAGIYVENGATLHLEVNGTLKTYGGDGGDSRGAAGIGSDDDSGCGDMYIVVNDGGSIEAYGYHGAAGIGGGDDGSVGTIDIKGTSRNTKITASGEAGGAGIGGSSDGKLTTLTIDGIGTLKCKGGSNAAGIGGGDHDGIGDGGNVGNVTVKNCGTVEATGGNGGAGIGGGEDADIKSVTVENCDDVTATSGKGAAGIGTGRDSTSGVEVGCDLVAVKNSKVNATCSDDTGAGIGCGGSAHVVEIYIDAQKDIIAKGHGDGSGIGYAGGGLNSMGSRSADKITINKVTGNVTATAGSNGSGIGLGDVSLSDSDKTIGTITIDMNGGSINATASGSNNAGIGGGRPIGDYADIRKIKITGAGNITSQGTPSGCAIGSGEDSNVKDGIEIIGTANKGDLKLDVSCANPKTGMATCPIIGIDNPDNDKSDATDITIHNAEITAKVTKTDGREAAVVIGGGEHAGMSENPGWINKIDIDNCKITMTGDSGVGVGGNMRVSVDTISINNTDYDGFAIGSMGWDDAMIFSGEKTTTMNRITIKDSNVKAIAKYRQANDSCVFTMAGIGGGNKTDVGEIEIDNSNVTAQGLLGGAGIGGGGYTYNSSFLGDFFTVYGDMGDYFTDKITIKNNSTVNATGSAGQVYEYMRPIPVLSPEGTVESVDFLTRNFCGCASGIGGGGFQSVKEINISDSNVTSLSAGVTNEVSVYNKKNDLDSGAAGIGGGSMGTSDKISISNSTVNSTGTFSGAGIGGAGKDPEVQNALLKAFSADIGKSTVPDITIENKSNVTSYGGFYGAGIGAGERGKLQNITIDGSSVNATGGEGAAGIGGGTNANVSEANLTIKGSSNVIACGGKGGAGMGTGAILDKHSVSGDDIFDTISISSLSTVHADGGDGAAAIGGGCGDNNYLTEELKWSNGDNKRAGTLRNFILQGEPLVVAACGRNRVSENYDDVEYASPAVDVGKGGSFIEGDNPVSAKMDIQGGTLLCLGSDNYSTWNESFRQSASANTLSPDASGNHIDRAGSNKQVYKVTLRVPNITDYTKVNVSVTGDGSMDANNMPYYNYTPLYTDAEGVIYLWLQPGAENKTNARVEYAGDVINYVGTSRTDNTGMLVMEGRIELEDNLSKVYDGEPVEEPPLKVCDGFGEVTYTYYRYKWEEGTSQESDLTDDLKIPAEEVVNAGDYTVRVDMSETEENTSCYDIGSYTILPVDTTITSLSAIKQGSGSNYTVKCTAKVYGLSPNDTDMGVVQFKITQGDFVARGTTRDISSDMSATYEFEFSEEPAGSYDVEATFVCNPRKPNYNNSTATRTYNLDMLTATIDMEPIRLSYGDDAVRMPSASLKPIVDVPGSPDDIPGVESGLTYTLINPDKDVVTYSDGMITPKNIGLTFMKVEFAGNSRVNPTRTLVPIIVQRKAVTATPKVSVLGLDDETWSEFDTIGETYYRRTRQGDYIRYRVDYVDENGEIIRDVSALYGLTEPIPLTGYIPASDTPYEVPVVRRGINKNYKVTLGTPALVTVSKGIRELSVECDDVTFGQIPRPEVDCDVKYAKRELTLIYSGKTNSGRIIDREAIPPFEAGEYSVTALLSERPNYASVSSEPEPFMINRADLNLHVFIRDYEYGESANIRVAGIEGRGDVTYTFYKDDNCTILTSVADGAEYPGGEPKNIGTYYVVVDVSQTNNYNAASSYPKEFSIKPRQVEVRAEDASKTHGKSDPQFNATITGLLGDDTVDYTLSREPGEDVGSYAIIPSGEVSQGNYEVNYVNGTFTIESGYTLYFDLDGGTIDGNAGSIEYRDLEDGDEIIIPGPPKKDGYEFLYWEGSRYYPGDRYVVNGPHKFTAVWAEADSADGSGISKRLRGLIGTGDVGVAVWIMLITAIIGGLGVIIWIVAKRKRS